MKEKIKIKVIDDKEALKRCVEQHLKTKDINKSINQLMEKLKKYEKNII